MERPQRKRIVDVKGGAEAVRRVDVDAAIVGRHKGEGIAQASNGETIAHEADTDHTRPQVDAILAVLSLEQLLCRAHCISQDLRLRSLSRIVGALHGAQDALSEYRSIFNHPLQVNQSIEITALCLVRVGRRLHDTYPGWGSSLLVG
jgi:hypothetical protein